jgi:hypothetical protein
LGGELQLGTSELAFEEVGDGEINRAQFAVGVGALPEKQKFSAGLGYVAEIEVSQAKSPVQVS